MNLPPTKQGFTLLEMLVVIAILAILFVLASVVMGSVKDRAANAKSLSNLRQCNSGLLNLAASRDGILSMRSGGLATGTVQPEFQFWAQQLERQMDFTKREIFFSDKAEHGFRDGLYSSAARDAWPWRVSYGVNFISDAWQILPRVSGQPIVKSLRLVNVEKPSQTVLLASSINLQSGTGRYGIDPDDERTGALHLRYNGKALAGFLDGSVRLLGPDELAKLGFTGGVGESLEDWIPFTNP